MGGGGGGGEGGCSVTVPHLAPVLCNPGLSLNFDSCFALMVFSLNSSALNHVQVMWPYHLNILNILCVCCGLIFTLV